MELKFIIIKTNTKDIGKMENSMEKENIYFQMVLQRQVFGKMARESDGSTK